MAVRSKSLFTKVPPLPSIQKDGTVMQDAGISVSIPDDVTYSSKLSNVESQRIMAVLQEIQKKVHIVGLLNEGCIRNKANNMNGEVLALLTV
jgi:hypothetical protein